MFSLEIDWDSICLAQFNKKSRNTKVDFKEKEKILRFLAYRGFSYEIIKSALKEFD
jgi:SOS response regulatory protein OraA/RecX